MSQPSDSLANWFAQMMQHNQQWLASLPPANATAEAPTPWPQTPEAWMNLQQQWAAQAGLAWQSMMPAEPTPDKRFAGKDWDAYPFFNYLKQSYLQTSAWLLQGVDQAPLDDDQKTKARFFTQQLIDAMSPSNFLLTNPEALQLAVETKGESLQNGMKMLLGDLQKGYLTMTDESQFEVGVNMAITPGKVVFENELFQLIEYTPSTEQVFERPLLVIPPCVNKYYLMDMQPENSLIRYLVGEGNRVFLMSWRSANEEMKHFDWEDYLTRGVFPAIETVKHISKKSDINALGFCIGGVILTTALAVLKAKGDDSIVSATYLTSMIDHREPGPIKAYLDENMVRQREGQVAEGGVIKGRELSAVFSSLRANDLIWNYVVNNYLKGKTPPPFDLLYWNSDATNLPLPMHTYLLRNMYLDNKLAEPGALTLCGVPVDVTAIDLPSYIFAAQDDHIVPWKSAYRSTQYLSGPLRFVLGESGHIAGTINPVSKNKRHYWTLETQPDTAEKWLAQADKHPGSWWADYSLWLAGFAGKKVAAPKSAGNRTHKIIEDAPGRYVKARV